MLTFPLLLLVKRCTVFQKLFVQIFCLDDTKQKNDDEVKKLFFEEKENEKGEAPTNWTSLVLENVARAFATVFSKFFIFLLTCWSV